MHMRVGFIGYRGMVGSVLLERMLAENDFDNIEAYFYSTSNIGKNCSYQFSKNKQLLDAYNLSELMQMECIVTTYGNQYTNQVLPKLRENGYNGYFIDASSALRMNNDTVITLDPVNNDIILNGLKNGIKNFAGGNCSITLSMIGLSGLLKNKLIESMSMMTYQAASGAGAKNVRELLRQMNHISTLNYEQILDDNIPILELIHNANCSIKSNNHPTHEFNAPLAGSLIPWIDADLNNGNSKEEIKAELEANKILGLPPKSIKIDGLCVRVGVIRSHSAAITMKLKQNLPIHEIEQILIKDNPWINYVPNNKVDTLANLNPVATSNTLKIAVGRLKQSSLGENIYHIFTVGDQLLWGAAEPMRRTLNIILKYNQGLL